MKSIALIPARGGSKRLPRKNILPFLGKPMIAYSIEAAQNSNMFERVVVSTEDPEIANVAHKYGAEVDNRTLSLATDKTMVRTVAHDFLTRQERNGANYDLLCVLYATAPMRTSDDIINVLTQIEPGVCHHALAVKEYETAPHQALKVVSSNGDLEPMWPEIVAARADSLPRMLVDNGSTYCVMVEDFMKDNNFYAKKMRGYTMPLWKSVDIDTIEDFEIAEYFYKKNKERHP